MNKPLDPSHAARAIEASDGAVGDSTGRAPPPSEPADAAETPSLDPEAAIVVDPADSETDEFEDEGPIREDEDMQSLEPPSYIKEVLDYPERYILPGVSPGEFMQMFESLEEHFKAKNLPEYELVFDYTMLVMEVLRYRRMKVSIERNNQRAALEMIFRRTCDGKVPKDATHRYFSEPEFQEKTRKDFEREGFSPDAVEVQAFERSLFSVAAVEKLIASAQKRITAFTKDLEKRYADRAVRLKRAALEALTETL